MLEALSLASNMGFIMLVNTAVGLLIGKGFDKWLDSSPWGVAVGTLFGLIAGLAPSVLRSVTMFSVIRLRF